MTQDRRDAAEEVDVDDRERADREEHGPWKAAENGDHEREDEDEDLRDQEDLHVDPEGREDVRERLLELLAVEERLLDVVPTGRVDDDDGDDQPDDDERSRRGRRRRSCRRRPSSSRRGSSSRGSRPVASYFRIGAPVRPSQRTLELLERAVRAHGVHRLVDAANERVALLEHQTEVLLGPLRGACRRPSPSAICTFVT